MDSSWYNERLFKFNFSKCHYSGTFEYYLHTDCGVAETEIWIKIIWRNFKNRF